jgi:nucleoside-diphosphate-sugar epimerase
MSTSGKRILFTGGSGKAGRHVIPYLLNKGHTILNVDIIPFPDQGVVTLKN